MPHIKRGSEEWCKEAEARMEAISKSFEHFRNEHACEKKIKKLEVENEELRKFVTAKHLVISKVTEQLGEQTIIGVKTYNNLQDQLTQAQEEIKRIGNLTVADSETFKISKLWVETQTKNLKFMEEITTLKKEIEEIKRQRIMEQGAWEQADAYKENNATLKKQLAEAKQEIEFLIEENK